MEGVFAIMTEERVIAKVDALYPNRVIISVFDPDRFTEGQKLSVGAYLHLEDANGMVLIATVENITEMNLNEETEDQENAGKYRAFRLEGQPLGTLNAGHFERGSASIAIPVVVVRMASHDEIYTIFEESVAPEIQFCFSHLAADSSSDIRVPVDGNRFFNKHIAVVGSTGSGKSYTVAKILQTACGTGGAINNSHIVIFDIHSEYSTAFPDACCLDISNLALPYWLMTSTELMEFFLDTDGNDHNQRNVFKEAVIMSKQRHFTGPEEQKSKLTLDTPVYFEIEEVLQYAIEKNEEMIPGARGEKAGPLHGKLSNFIDRLMTKLSDQRLRFLLGQEARQREFEAVLSQLMGYGESRSNVTILDVSGVPFEVLSITVSLVSRILFEYGYYYKRIRMRAGERIQNDVPVLLVYEEAHKYVPNSSTAKYRAARESIERIAKEGRKYGVSLMLASQRPSEISDTIFAQCNNFVAMRLTNPSDQLYVKRLLPDSMGSIVDSLPSLQTGECLLTGEAIVMPCLVKIDPSDRPPASDDIPYWSLWQEPWHGLNINEIREHWMAR